jgi:hypothetical protein
MGKVAYRVPNRKQYNRALINRGNLTVWINEDVIESWYADPKDDQPSDRGRPRVYSDLCIQMALTLRSLFHFPLRATQGFIEGLVQLLEIDLEVPCYTQLSRRAGKLEVRYYSEKTRKKPVDLVVDSTGLKIYGEGEWKMRTHGKQKRRTWRKLHLAVNADSFQTVSMELTLATIHDDEVMPALLKEQKKVEHVYADGAYISKDCFDSIVSCGARAKIALRSGTGLVKKNPLPGQLERNRLVQEIWKAGGRIAWKKTSGYHRRSLVETQMYRFKTILGSSLSSRSTINQIAEAKTKILILNRMTRLGMPDSVQIQ